MEQTFREAGTTGIVSIVTQHVGGEDVIFWDDIVQVFPGAKHIVNGDAVVYFLQDSDGDRCLPQRIRYCPGEVLEVVKSFSLDDLSDQSPAEDPEPSLHDFISDLLFSSSSSSSNDNYDLTSSITSLSETTVSDLDIAAEPFNNLGTLESEHLTMTAQDSAYLQTQIPSVAAALELARESGITLDLEQIGLLFNAGVAQALTFTPEFESTMRHGMSAIHDRTSRTQQIALEVFKLQKQMRDRSTLIQNKTEAVLTQSVDLSACPTPGLFVVLPEEQPTEYDPTNWFETVFRLYYICECGEHTRTAGSKIPHYLHLANHEGYVVHEPTTFFKKYGPFLLLMLEMIKYGTTLAGHAVPALASLKIVELGESGQHAPETVIARIDYSLECINGQMKTFQATSQENLDDTSHHMPTTQQELANYLDGVDGDDGVDLRRLKSFLVTPEDADLLGNLRRIFTSDGYVKWVCLGHYQKRCEEEFTQKLHAEVQIAGGKFDEQLGRVEIALQSRAEAARFFDAMCKAPSVLELIVDVKWECSKKDLDELQDAIKRSLVSVLHVDIQKFQPSFTRKLLPMSTRYDGVNRLLEPTNLKSIHLVLPRGLGRLSNFTPKKPVHVRKLSFEMVVGSYEGNPGKEVRIHAEVVGANTTLTTMYMRDTSNKERGAFSLSEDVRSSTTLTTLHLPNNLVGQKGTRTLSEGLKSNETVDTVELYNNSIGEKGAKYLSAVLKTNSILATLILHNNSIGDRGAQLLSEALEINTALTTLDLQNNGIGERGAKALAEALKINKTLTTLDLGYNRLEDRGAKAIFGALKINYKLAKLDMNDNSIEKKGARALSEALKINSTLKTLNLHGNPIGDRGVQMISEALKVNNGLTTLSLWDISVGEIGAQALATALETNTSLSNLDLWGNSVGEKGAEALSEALQINTTLAILVLDNNSIEKNGATALAGALKTNQTLTTLRMVMNPIGDVGAEALSEAIEINSTLTTLHLFDESIGEEGLQALRDAHETNTTLVNVDWNDSLSAEESGQELSRSLVNRSIVKYIGTRE